MNEQKIWDRLFAFAGTKAAEGFVCEHPERYVYNIDVYDEREMMKEMPHHRLGDLLMREITVRGVRVALPTLYGHPIDWGKERTCLVRISDAGVLAS